MMELDHRTLRELLPWRAPFAMVDALVDCRPGERIRTRKLVSAGDPALAGAGRDGTGGWFPAALLLEGMSQSAALLFRLTYRDVAGDALPLLGFLEARLHGSVRAGEPLEFDVQAVKMTRRGGLFRAAALGGADASGAAETRLAEAELAFAAAPQPAGPSSPGTTRPGDLPAGEETR